MEPSVRTTATKHSIDDPFTYFHGFDAYHLSECKPGYLPTLGALPQRLKSNLFPERISGTSFTTARAANKQTWLYRTLPSTSQSEFKPMPQHPANFDYSASKLSYAPNQTMWFPFNVDSNDDFLTGLRHIGGAGDPISRAGVAYYAFGAGRSMPANQAFYTADGDFLVVVQSGVLDITTEMGKMRVRPSEICVLPRGIRYHVAVKQGPARGYALEVFAGHFELPELGLIGSFGFANVQDFQTPTASIEEGPVPDTELLCLFNGKMYRADYKGSVFNVVAWKGTYYPYKYDMGKFNLMGSVSYDHPDPSVFTVLTCPSSQPGHPTADFLCLGPRWLVMEDSFRPPYFHRNVMSEFAGVISGGFDVERMDPKMEGMITLINPLSPHGPSKDSFTHATTTDLKPVKVPEGHMAFMFESRYMIGLSEWAVKSRNKLLVGERLGEYEIAKL